MRQLLRKPAGGRSATRPSLLLAGAVVAGLVGVYFLSGWLNRAVTWSWFDSTFAILVVTAVSQIVLAAAVFLQIQAARDAVDVADRSIEEGRRSLEWQAADTREAARSQMRYQVRTKAGEDLTRSCARCFAQLRQVVGRLTAEAAAPGSSPVTIEQMRLDTTEFADRYVNVYESSLVWELHGGATATIHQAADFAEQANALHEEIKNYGLQIIANKPASRPDLEVLVPVLDAVTQSIAEDLQVALVGKSIRAAWHGTSNHEAT